MPKVPFVSMIDPRGQGGRDRPDGRSWCALCGGEYLAGVVECADCLVPLVDQPPLAVADIGDEDGEQIAYEYDDVEATERLAIDRMLADRGIVHAWDGTTLVVAPYDEAEVDELLDKVDAPHDIDDALLDEDAEQLVYDIGDWDSERRAELDGLLEAAGLPHAFDEDGDLVVLAADEEQVDAIVDQVEFPDQLDPTADEPGGLDAVETIGDLFVATDRLVHDPSDSDGVLTAVDASRAMEKMPVPFGFAPPVWEELRDRAAELRRLLEADTELVDDAAVIETATRLRAALRTYV
jgi:hypothetical protein